MATTRGTRVASQEMGLSSAKEREVANSRLVLQSEAGIDFALPLFREWYAAKSILEGTVRVTDHDLKSDRWTVPISMVVHSRVSPIVPQVMEYLVSANVSMAAAVLKEDEAAWYVDEVATLMPASAGDAGEQVRGAMFAWERGLGKLFRLVGPIDARGKLATVGVRLEKNILTIAWLTKTDRSCPVVEFEESNDPFGKNEDRVNVEWESATKREIPRTHLWSWVITREQLADSLMKAVEQRELFYVAEEARRELLWDFATVVGGRGSVGKTTSVVDSLERVEKMLGRVDTVRWSKGGGEYSRREIEIIRDGLLTMKRSGDDLVCDPWPAAEVGCSSGGFRYSDQRIVDRTNAVYAGALRIYKRVVEHWFGAFAESLSLYRLLPVRLEGKVSDEGAGGRGRSVWWRPVILPRGEESQVVFTGGAWGRNIDATERYFEEQWDAYRRLRRDDTDGVVLFENGALLDTGGRCPATDLAVEWLSRELEDLGWGGK